MQAFFHRTHVGQAQLGLDDLNVGNGIDLVGHVNHVLVFKTAHHVDDGIGLADMGQKLVAQAFALAGPGHQTGNVHKLHNRRHDAFGLDNARQLLQARVGHLDHPHIGFDGAERVVLGRNARFGQGVEQGGFTNVGQAHNTAFETHGNF